MSRRRLDIDTLSAKTSIRGMSLRPTPFAPEEWYHCYNRGVEKRKTFLTNSDYQRFMHLLYLSNSDVSVHRSNLLSKSSQEIYGAKRGKQLVAIGAYALMPNHFHLQLKEITENGISTFMQKLGTAYSMYFNIKNEHTGGIFIKPFRSKHIDNDEYLNYLTQYIHLNPAELFEPEWKKGHVKNLTLLEEKLEQYHYSSFVDYSSSVQRPERVILDSEAIELLGKGIPPLKKVLTEAAEYYHDLAL